MMNPNIGTWPLVKLTARESLPNNIKGAAGDKECIGIDGENRFFQPFELVIIDHRQQNFLVPTGIGPAAEQKCAPPLEFF